MDNAAVEAFLADLREVYQKHQMIVGGHCCYEPRVIAVGPTPESVRVRAKCQPDPAAMDDGEFDDYRQEVYEAVPQVDIAIDRIRGSHMPSLYFRF